MVHAPALPTPLRDPARRDPLFAIALAVALFASSLIAGFGMAEAVGGALLCAPLASRTRRPLATLATIAGGALLFLTVVEPRPTYAVPLSVALYTVAARGTRVRTVAIGMALVVYVVVVAVAFSPDNGPFLQQVSEPLFQLGFALALGEAIRSRRALITALRERAEHAERALELESQRRVEEERVRIAREVHDVVAHSLATISTQAGVGVHVARLDPADGVEVLESIKEVSTGALQDLRYAVGALREDGSAPTRPMPSLQDVPELVGRARESGMPVELRTRGAQAELPIAVQTTVYRIVQESLTNVMRHAHGASARVSVAADGGHVDVEVLNDATGAPTARSVEGRGSGLIGMRERASALGGSFEAGRVGTGGFRVHAVLPVGTDAA